MRSEVRVTRSLRYGRASTLELEVAPQTLLADGLPAPGVLADPMAATIAALSNPRQYPPLSQSVVPGDRVVIAAQADIPCLPAIVAGVTSVLDQAGLEQENRRVVLADTSSTAGEGRSVDGDTLAGLAWEWHDPSDKSALCYLAAEESGAPIYLNRHLCDADVIIPIGLLRPRGALGYLGLHSGLFPAFSDVATRQRFSGWTAQAVLAARKKLRREAIEVDWLLGLQLAMQIVAGPGDTVRHVLAGLLSELREEGRALAEAAWACACPQRADFVVAAIGGGPSEQTWTNFARPYTLRCRSACRAGRSCSAPKYGVGPARRCSDSVAATMTSVYGGGCIAIIRTMRLPRHCCWSTDRVNTFTCSVNWMRRWWKPGGSAAFRILVRSVD